MIVKIIAIFFCIVFPCAVFFARDEPGKSFVALVLQGTLFGWPLASYWALKPILKKHKPAENSHSQQDNSDIKE